MAKRSINFRTIGINGVFIVAAVGLIGASLLPLLPTSASIDGKAMPDGKVVKFVHGGASEWWVQVRLLGDGGAQAKTVEAKASSGAWVALGQQNWTEDGSWWALSTHVPTGDDVKFRVTTATVTNFESCWFSHPAGKELCGKSHEST